MILEATLGAGCFWCIEACFKDVIGILEVIPGYCGGDESRISYEDICTGTTGHAEVARIKYDNEIISFEKLLELFWFVHDPTQFNRQGNDIGTQYRSAIFYHSNEQKVIADNTKRELDEKKVWSNPIVTEISPVPTFFEAGDYHTNYFEKNPQSMYCQSVVRPKVDRFKTVFKKVLK